MNDTTNLENLTDEQIEFLITYYDRERRWQSVSWNLAPYVEDLIRRGLVTLVKLTHTPPQHFIVTTSQLGGKYLEENHIVALIEELGAMGYPGTARLVGRLDVTQLPELLASETEIVRCFAIKRFEHATRVE